MSNPNNRQYSNDDVTVFWKPESCIHATTCFMKLRKVFDPSKRPWINMANGSTEEIVDIVEKCPTDALTWKYNKDLSKDEFNYIRNAPQSEEKVPTAPKTEIIIVDNGPAIIKGSFKMARGSGEIIETGKQVALCRCGGSKNHPFCDGDHLVNGFRE
jgi:uncharacterized Fe-S cluster protein YjdI